MIKKFLSVLFAILIVLSFTSCEDDNQSSKYDDNYDYEEDYYEEDYYDDVVYVSKSGKKVHSISNCSGMKYYIRMTYRQAESNGYSFCKNCW